jgi:EpsD family peptidyl-prolyl cis-trans isomerase
MLLLRPLSIFVALFAAVSLAACDNGSRPAVQVAARVNKEAVTVQQLNAELARLRGLNEAQRKGAAKQILDRLVDQELLAQQATARRIDRDPRVLQAIESSRRQILAQAYLDSVTSGAPPPSAEEVKRFYDAHPELFAERKLYRLQELAIASRPELSAARLEDELKKAKSLNDVVEWLKHERIPFNASSTVKAAEQLPMEVVPRLAALATGQAMLIPTQQGYLVVQIAATESKPLTAEEARPFVEQYVANQKRMELARSEIRKLRDFAKIEYSSDFAGSAAVAGPKAPGPAAPPVADPSTAGTAPRDDALK